MNREQADALARREEVKTSLKAFEEALLNDTSLWEEFGQMLKDRCHKPALSSTPREWWLLENSTGRWLGIMHIQNDPSEAKEQLDTDYPDCAPHRVVRVREVVDE